MLLAPALAATAAATPRRPTAAARLSVTCRLQALEFSCSKVIRSVHTGGVMCLDLDPTERRYLLAGAADASIAVYDTQQPTGQDKAAAQEAGREAAGAEAALTNNAPYLRTSAQVTAARTGAGAAEHTEHAALCSISKQTPGAHRFSVSAVAWYPVDAGLFVSGERLSCERPGISGCHRQPLHATPWPDARCLLDSSHSSLAPQ